jgi:hypothetical protein
MFKLGTPECRTPKCDTMDECVLRMRAGCASDVASRWDEAVKGNVATSRTSPLFSHHWVGGPAHT